MTKPMIESLIEYDQSVGEDDPFDLVDEVYKLADNDGWPSIIFDAVDILLDYSKKERWYLTIAVIDWAVEDKIKLPFDWKYLVALFYGCLNLYPNLGRKDFDDGGNLVWSAASALKGVGYMSDWCPEDDTDIINELKKINWKNT